MMTRIVTGYFREFDLTLDTENDDFNTANNIVFTADINSIDIHHVGHKKELKSADFLNSRENKTVRFAGTRFVKANDQVKLNGDLTINNKTNPITLTVHFGGIVQNGVTKADFNIEGQIRRDDFGLTLRGSVIEFNELVLSNEIDFWAKIQLKVER